MGQFISFGKYNQSYKYIWLFVIIKLINEYIFGYSFPEQIKPDIFNPFNYPPNKLVQLFFIYFGSFLLSCFIYLYEKLQMKKLDGKTKKLPHFLFKYKFHVNNGQSIKSIFLSIIFFSIIGVISMEAIGILMG